MPKIFSLKNEFKIMDFINKCMKKMNKNGRKKIKKLREKNNNVILVSGHIIHPLVPQMC
jgi:aromatic ring-opening dioxygenase catalytic subunit (LigB family)